MSHPFFHIGSIAIPDRVIMAPMAGITNGPFRRIAYMCGCRVFWTEMVAAQGLVRRRPEIMALLPDADEAHPLAVQLFGADPAVLAEAAAMAGDAGADIIDLNMACPVKRICRQGAGVMLMKNPSLISRIVRRVKQSSAVPVTIKIRLGWDDQSINAVEVAAVAVDSGVDAITIHGRTRAQGFRGKADHALAARMAEQSRVPVIISGDIGSGPEASRMLAITGAAAVMIGRAAMGNPWIYGNVSHYLKTGVVDPAPNNAQKLTVILEHLRLSVAKLGEHAGGKMFAPHLAAYVKGRPDASFWRRELIGERNLIRLREKLAVAFGD